MSMMEFATESSAPDNLLAGDLEASEQGVILSGTAAALRGQLLGKVCRTVGTATYAGTGTGVIGTILLGVKTMLGNYKLICIAAASNAGTFRMYSPDGAVVGGDITVAVAYTSDHLNFTIADGATDFIVGDTFTVPVGSGSGKYRVYNTANVDGSQYPSAILAEDADGSAADVPAAIYLAGQFRASAIIGYTAALKDVLRDIGIIVKQ